MLACHFYQTEAGNEPVREWLKGLPAHVRREVGSDIQQVQWRWPIGKPLVDGFGNGLYEVRTGVDTNIYRVLFCIEGGMMVLLHGFTKKSQKTPAADLETAKRRQREVEKS
jgi:phage-related protein